METVDLERIIVKVENVGNGQKRLKRLKNGNRPMDELADIIAEKNEAFKNEYGRDGFDWSTYEEAGAPGERAHLIFVLYSKEVEGERIPIRRFVLWDEKEDKPVPIPLKVPNKPGMRMMAREDTLEHVGNFLDFSKMRAEAEERGLKIQHTASWDALERAKRRMEI